MAKCLHEMIIFFILFCFVLGWGGILESAFDWSYDEILEPFESARRFLFTIDSTSRLLQLSWIPVFFCLRFYFQKRYMHFTIS